MRAQGSEVRCVSGPGRGVRGQRKGLRTGENGRAEAWHGVGVSAAGRWDGARKTWAPRARARRRSRPPSLRWSTTRAQRGSRPGPAPDGPRASRPLRDGETIAWREQRFATDGAATFIGCRDHGHLTPCSAPSAWNGLLAAGSLGDLIGHAAAMSVATGSGLLLVSLFSAIVAGAYTWVALRRAGGVG